MVKEKMNIHRALCELKILDDRIGKETRSLVCASTTKHLTQKVGSETVKDFSDRVKREYQSVQDLITRRNAIKRAVVLSNAVTKVTIGDVDYSVAEAIDMKNHGMACKKELRARLAWTYEEANARAAADNRRLEDAADVYVKDAVGGKDVKNLSEEAKKLRQEYIEARTIDVVDPLGAAAELKKLDDEISAFTVEVDAVLSTSNATTEIEIEY